MRLDQKIVVIPGASRPIGRAIARLFGKLGAMLILPVFDWPDSISEMENEFSSAGVNYKTLKLDLRLSKDVDQIANLLAENYGHLDYLINNIERGGMPIVHGSYELPHNENQWDTEFDTTLKAKWLLFQCCLPYLKKNSGAAVVNISSVAGEIGRSGPGAAFFNDGYSAANKAIQTFTQTWAREAAPEVRVNELQLGFVKTRHGENTRGWDTLEKSEKQNIINHTLLGRTGDPEEVAECVLFLAVTARYATGSIMKMDGGLTLGSNLVPPMPPGIL